MTYRDPNDAVCAKVDALEQQMEELRQQVQALREGAAQASQQQVPPAVAPPPSQHLPPPPDFRPGLGVALFVGVLLTTMGVRWAASHMCHGPMRRMHSVAMSSAGTSMLHSQPFYEPVVFQAKVQHATGFVAAREGDACTVTVTPVSSPTFNCRVVVQCGSETLYGRPRAGFTQCMIENEQPIAALDDLSQPNDGDPRLEMDRRAGSLVVSHDIAQGAYRVELGMK